MPIDIQPYKTGTHPVGSGEQRLYRFTNGFGASVVRFLIGGMAGSYGAEAGLWELAVLKFESALLVRIRDLDENGRES